MIACTRCPSIRALRLTPLLPFLLAASQPLSCASAPPRSLCTSPLRGQRAAVCSAADTAMADATGGHMYKWPRPSVTVDAIIVARGTPVQLLLIQRKHDPFAGNWALPGGFVDENEPLDQAAARELQEETSVDPASVLLTQVGAFGDPGRDPRGWCITVAYAALVPTTELGVKAADDAQAAEWFPISQLPRLAFDHKLVVRAAFRHLAQQEAVQQQAGLAGQLQAAADGLEGPWQQQ